MPDFIGVDIVGMQQLMQKLNKLPPAVQEEAVRAAADETVNVMRVYPPVRGVSVHRDGTTFKPLRPYVRTFTLKNNWVIIGQGKNEMVVNQTPYAQYVMGDDTQAWMHKGFWKTIQKRLEENSQKLNKVLQQAADRAIRKLGLK